MKHIRNILVAFAVVTLLIVAPSQVSGNSMAQNLNNSEEGDSVERASSVGRGAPPESTDEQFVADTGDELDQYLFHTDDDGFIRFNILITRFFFNENISQRNFSDGFLTSEAAQYLVENNVLPEYASLVLRVWDVDQNNQDSNGCSEVDYIWVNGNQIKKNGIPVKLTGADNTWSTPGFEVPIQYLRFPTQKGDGAPPIPADNEIAIQVDVMCQGSWAVKVDWGLIRILNTIRPIVFVHGWTGNTTAFNQFEGWLADEGIPSGGQADLREGLYPIDETANWLASHIYGVLLDNGVEKVNLFAHSKGGLVSRAALKIPRVAESVETLITFGSPHHGTIYNKTVAYYVACKQFKPDDLKVSRCEEVGKEFTKEQMRERNYSNCEWSLIPWGWQNCTPKFSEYLDTSVVYYSFIGTSDEAVNPDRSGAYPWQAYNNGDFPDGDDGDYMDFLYPKLDHGGIKESREVYECAIHQLVSTRYSDASCSTPPQLRELNTATADTYLLIQSAAQPAYQTRLSNVIVDAIGDLFFELISDVPVSFSIIDPSGFIIDPAAASTDDNIDYYEGVEPGGYLYRYTLSTMKVGTWQSKITTANLPAEYLIYSVGPSSVILNAASDKFGYLPNETVNVQVSMIQNQLRMPDTVLMGLLTYPDQSTVSITFYDDGTHGDLNSNDGVFAAQFLSGGSNGYGVLSIEGQSGGFVRNEDLPFIVGPKTGEIQNVSQVFPSDDNSNGLYDYLNVVMGINVLQAGHFDVEAILEDSLGNPIATAYYSSRHQTLNGLSTGVNQVTLQFKGESIYQNGINGPYHVSEVRLYDVTEFARSVDKKADILTTSSYLYTGFEHPLIVITDLDEIGVDTNGNGQYENLIVGLTIDVVQPGTYDVNGRLVTENSDEIGWAATSFSAGSSGQYTVQLMFDGTVIGENRFNGPYILTDLSIFNSVDSANAFLLDVYTTQPYSFIEFEGGFYKAYLPSISRLPLLMDAYEPDNTYSQAKMIYNGRPQIHSINPATDLDWEMFSVPSTAEIFLYTEGIEGDTRLWLYDSGLNLVEYDDDSGVGLFSSITRLCSSDPLSPGTYYAKIDEFYNDDIIDEYTITVFINPCANPDLYEPDNLPEQSSQLISNSSQIHSIRPSGDVDWLTFTINNNSEVFLLTDGDTGDTRMWLYNSNFDIVAFNDDSDSSLFSQLMFLCDQNPLPPGQYFIRVDEYFGTEVIPFYWFYYFVNSCP